ncbi:MAG TPA: hypothetical protein VIQ74_14340 [Gemmatimonadaceae bacterium]
MSLGGFLLGVWISLLGSDIGQSMRVFFGLPVLVPRSAGVQQVRIVLERGGIDWWTTAFWIATALYAWVVYKRLQHEDARETERAMAIIRTIHRSPNINVIRYYPDYYRAFQRALQSQEVDDEMSEHHRLQAFSANIRAGLDVIADMAQEFARANGASYGANVMLVARRPFTPDLIKALRFHPKTDTEGLLAILYLPEALLVTEREGQKARHIPCISLPVPREEYNQRGERLALFGAPTALLRGEPSVYLDTRDVSSEYEDLAKPIQSEISEYFSPDGDGRDVRSFASFRIGYSADNPIGVVNIDSNEQYVLGRDEEFFVTFRALMEPLLDMIAPQVVEYARLLSASTTPIMNNSSQATDDQSGTLPASIPSGNIGIPLDPNPETLHDQEDVSSR